MAFEPRTFEQIYADMEAYVRLQTDLTDFEVGSVTRTILESAALEDDEQYFQMVQLLDAFRLSTATGSELDGRVAEYGITREQQRSASVAINITNTALSSSTLAFSLPVSTTTLTLEDSTAFPTSGYPYTVRIGEGTVLVEELLVSANDGATQLTTTTGLVNPHLIGARVSLVAGADILLSPGIRVQVPSVAGIAAVVFITTESGTIVAGNYQSTSIRARAEVPGIVGNIGRSKIREFASSPPFNGAAVVNLTRASGGRDIESDADLRDRARAHLQSLSAGTVLALRESVLGVTDPVTGQSVTTANVLEDFVQNEVIVYVDDGTGFDPDTVELSRSTLDVANPGATVTAVDASGFPEEGWLLLSPEDPAQIEILPFSTVDHTLNTISLTIPCANLHTVADEIAVVDVLSTSTKDGERFFDTTNTPIVRSSFRLWVRESAGSPVLQEEDVDYVLNKGTGQVEFFEGLSEGALVAAHYTYYTALIANVQKVINGDSEDPTTFPGVRAAGVRVLVECPSIRRVNISVTVSAAPGFQVIDLQPLVQETLETYVNSLGIGNDVILAELITRAMEINGVSDVQVVLPTVNLVVLEHELPRPVDADGDSLVTVN